MQSAKEITFKAKSNLAFALLRLPQSQRDDMVAFYAFCRIIDDIADSVEIQISEKKRILNLWKNAISQNILVDELGGRLKNILSIITTYNIEPKLFTEIIDGCSSDISNEQRFPTIKDLEKYTYKVASCVGLVSIKIFNCSDQQSETYAKNLGHALQLTNILRDVGIDSKNGGRIYLPLELLTKYNLTQQDIHQSKYNANFIKVMHELADLAEQYYRASIVSLPTVDRKKLQSAEAMRKIYYNILQKMKTDDFQVFNKFYKLSIFKKIYHLIS